MAINPFAGTDKERAEIWEMLVTRDIEAFASGDWSMTEGDYMAEGFTGVDARYSPDPDGWRLSFPDLASYKTEWLRQSAVFRSTAPGDEAASFLFRATVLRDIEINGDSALAHKKFIWDPLKAEGHKVPANWQTLYHCRRAGGAWKISGFTGYLPFTGASQQAPREAAIQSPAGAVQHKTSGPYSPVLVVDPGRLVVISGQAAIDVDGNIVGDTIEEQAAFTLENCRKQLAVAGCGMDKVFKVAVYLKDMADWGRFNIVYRKYFEGTMPVRTAVQAGLLGTLLVEVECWATI